VTSEQAKALARDCGFELAGVASAEPLEESAWFNEWVQWGLNGEMTYLAGRPAEARCDPRYLLPEARSIICVGKLYNSPQPYSLEFRQRGRGWISRYAWGADYHTVVRQGLERLAEAIMSSCAGPFRWRAAVDSEPLLQRAYARRSGLGWIGKNCCLINQRSGSWFFLGALLVTLDLEPDVAAAGRCGTCTRCIDACPTGALIPTGRPGQPAFALDARRCVSYITIESKSEIPEALRPAVGRHVFGCDICQEVCPWNRQAPVTSDAAFAARNFAPGLEWLSGLSETEFEERFRDTPLKRTGYRRVMRNVSAALASESKAV
jgi:epoxyqueuosine reductase